MFGRSGQMFPRRAYHDAIYEEEYGSETEEECCRGRGLSAILCWFLSVIILIGLAASVVLTVFFVLKSRNFLPKNNPEDLNIVYDHGNGFKIIPTTSTMDVDFNFTSATSNNVPGSDNEDVPLTTSSFEAASRTTTTTTTTTTTMVPTTTRLTTRKYYSDTTGRIHDTIEKTTPMPSTTDGNSMFKFLFNTIKTFQNTDGFPETISSAEGDNPPADELLSNESNDRYVPSIAPTSPTLTSFSQSSTTKTMTATSPILFTLPPSSSTSMMNQYPSSKRNSASTRHPERTSFSSEEITSTTYKQDDHSHHDIPPGSSEEITISPVQSVTLKPSLMKPDEQDPDEINYQAEESTKLTKMLIDQIPPHGSSNNIVRGGQADRDDDDERLTTTTTPVPKTTVKEDLLARIIKNLQPKWNKSKSSETTTSRNDETLTTFRTRNRYVEIGSSREKDNKNEVKRFKYQRGTTAPPPPSTIIIITPDNTVVTTKADSTTIFTSTTASTALSSNVNNRFSPNTETPIRIIKAPEFVSIKGQKNSSGTSKELKKDSSNEFLDILVGSDDHKTLVTKETEDGVITSAILPPWFDSNATDHLEHGNRTMKFLTDEEDDSSNDHSKPKTDLDILLNLFSNSPLPITGNRSSQSPHPKSETYVSELSEEEAKKSLHLKNLEEQLKPFFSSPSEDVDIPIASGATTKQVSPANNAFHYGSSDGTTNIYGYYPDEDLDESESVDVDQVDIEIDPSRRNSSDGSHYQDRSIADDQNDHVIDIAYDPKVRPEIVIEPEAGEGEVEADDDYTDNDTYPDIVEPMAAGSDIHNHRVYAPPPNVIENDYPQRNGPGPSGSGIRHPLSAEEEKDDLSALANEPQPQIDWSMKADGNADTDTQGQPEEEGKRTPHELSLEAMEDQEFDEENNEANHKKAMSALQEVDDILDAGHEDYMERKPVVDLDDSLYPSKEEIPSTLSTTSTEKPKVNVYEVYSEPYVTPTTSSKEVSAPSTSKPELAQTAEESQTSEDKELAEIDTAEDGSSNATTKRGFVPPKPINFHENTYTFESQSSSEYHSKDGWRPVLFDRRGQGSTVHHTRAQLNRNSNKKQDFISTSMQPPQLQSTLRFDQVTTPVLSPTTTPTNSNADNSQLSDDYEDGDDAPSNEQWYSSGQTGSPNGNNNNNHEGENSKLNFKPSVRLPVTPPQHNPLQMPQSLPPRVTFPDNQLQQHHPQHIPIQQQAQQSIQNSIIDRSKYLNRPAPPPILMRRQPPFNIPFKLPHRKRNSNPTNGPPVRNFPRGPPQYPMPSGPGSGHSHFQHHENINPMAHPPGMRYQHEAFQNQQQSPQQPQGLPSTGGVHWPGEDQPQFTRNRNNNHPVNMNRRPSNG